MDECYNIRTMQKLASELKTNKVILRHEGALVGTIHDLVINPDDGKFLGFIIKEGFGKGKLKTLAEKDILGFNDQFILIASYDTLGEIDEIIRIKSVLDQKIPIIKNKVYTLSGLYLGKVTDFTVDFTSAKLSRLYVDSKSLKNITKDLLIDSKCIVTIKKDRITVDDSCVKEKNKATVDLRSTERGSAC